MKYPVIIEGNPSLDAHMALTILLNMNLELTVYRNSTIYSI